MGGSSPRSDVPHFMVIEVEPGDRQVGSRPGRLLLDRYEFPQLIQHTDPIALRVPHRVAEKDAALDVLGGMVKQSSEPRSVKYIVTQYQGNGVISDMAGGNQERIRNPPGLVLLRISQ